MIEKMNRLVLLLTTVILFNSCTKDVTSKYVSNENEFKSLIGLIKNNESYFNNEVDSPRLFYTYNFKKNYKEFISLNNKNQGIKEKDFNALQKLFEVLKINEFYMFNSDNILFKLDENWYSVLFISSPAN